MLKTVTDSLKQAFQSQIVMCLSAILAALLALAQANLIDPLSESLSRLDASELARWLLCSLILNFGLSLSSLAYYFLHRFKRKYVNNLLIVDKQAFCPYCEKLMLQKTILSDPPFDEYRCKLCSHGIYAFAGADITKPFNQILSANLLQRVA